MNRGYTIKKQSVVFGSGLSIYTLSIDGEFHLATNAPHTFSSLTSARITWRKLWKGHHARGSDFIYIEGPRGGTHRIGPREL